MFLQHRKKRMPITAVILGGMILLTGCVELSGASEQKNEQPAEVVVSTQEQQVQPISEPKADTAVPIPSNPSSIGVLVNKQYTLPADYVPADLVQPNVKFSSWEKDEKKLMRKEAAQALEQLFNEADRQGIELIAVSGYRSYKRQQAIYQSAMKRKGKEDTAKYNAMPGHSEHQTGLSIDVSSNSAGLALDESFANTKEGKWLAEHAHEFGFIIRYPKGEEEITGYEYEPWHIRYVGKEMAQEIKARGIVLEEYYLPSQK